MKLNLKPGAFNTLGLPETKVWNRVLQKSEALLAALRSIAKLAETYSMW